MVGVRPRLGGVTNHRRERARRELGPGAESGRGRTGHQGHPVEVLDEGSSLVFSPLSL
jgi:hypothetical protein